MSTLIYQLWILTAPQSASSQTIQSIIPKLTNFDITIKIIAIITLLSLAPSILITVTSFTRIVIILSLLRHALGIPQTPPNQIIIAISIFLTLFIMKPVYHEIDKTAIKPYIENKISDMEALKKATIPVKKFMLKNTRKEDLKLFLQIANEQIKIPDKIPFTTIAPAFMISEVKTAFEVVFIIYLPFLVIDLLVASILMSMGMMMIPPVMLSLPFKLILFVLSDGWEILIRAIIESYK